MRNRYLPILVFLLLSSLIGCSENSFSGAPENLSRSYGILGGQDVVESDPVARSTVMLSTLSYSLAPRLYVGASFGPFT